MSNITLNLGPALQAHQNQDVDACLEEIAPILQHVPHHPVALHLKAWAFSRRGQSGEALDILANLIAKNPDLVPARAEYAAILMANRRHEEALQPLKEACQLQPDQDELVVKYAICLTKNHQFKEAETIIRDLLERSPRNIAARYALAIALLQQGKWHEGFSQYRIRLWMDSSKNPLLQDEKREWKGGDLTGKHLLIQCEQGYGDQILFIRYARWIRENLQPAKITALARPELKPLFETAIGIDEVVSEVSKATFHYHIPLLHLPFLQRTMPDTIPYGDEAYLSVPAEKTEKWDDYYEDCENLDPGRGKIGLCWRSTRAPGSGIANSIDEEGLAKSLDCDALEFLCDQITALYPEAEICSLQVSETDEEMELMARRNIVKSPIAIRDFGDTAALIDQMELVVSIDTAVAHLAGALGKPVWTLLPYYADWRWSQDEEYSAWYPDMRLFRQGLENDWTSLDAGNLPAGKKEIVI